MSKIIEEIELIMVDLTANANKVWRGKLFDDDSVITEWGRVGYSLSSKTFPHTGKAQYDKLVKSKIKKGYSPTKTIKTDGTARVMPVNNISQLAQKQISPKNPVLAKLIDRLITENIHNIVSSTSIKYDAHSGLFQTPLGVVTPDGISEARNILINLKDHYDKGKSNLSLLAEYLKIIPHNYGMKLNAASILSDTFFSKANDTLDALTASFDAVSKSSQPTPKKSDEPKVFDIELDILSDQKEWDRLVKKYYATRKDQHVCKNLKPVNIYSLNIKTVSEAFSKKGAPLGSIHELWHGSRTANVLSILSKGLRVNPPNSVNKTGALFGRGLYFAVDSTKSLNYSFGYWSGGRDSNCFLFVADVALGRCYDPNYGDSIPSGYDSLWAKARKAGVRNDEIVIRNEYQCNLKYLIEFK